ncbi:hypothetical protein [Dactylosporangium roseum]|nr:hypothetical protein [Dactylosporangium roseum]
MSHIDHDIVNLDFDATQNPEPDSHHDSPPTDFLVPVTDSLTCEF